MFDIGWTEMLVVAVVMILVVGPKDLPGMLRTIGKTVGNARRMASDFQRQFSDALKEADIDEVKKDISSATSFSNPLEDINKSAEELMGSIDIDDSADSASEADIYANKEKKIASDVEGDVAAVKPVGTPVKPRKTSKGDAILAKKIAAGKKSAAGRRSTAKPATSKASPTKTSTAKTSTTKTSAAKTPAAKASAGNTAPKSNASKSVVTKKSAGNKAVAHKPATKSKPKIGSKSA